MNTELLKPLLDYFKQIFTRNAIIKTIDAHIFSIITVFSKANNGICSYF